LDLEFLDEEGCLFSVYANKAGFWVLNADLSQMHVDNLATFEVLVEESNDAVSALGDDREEFRFSNFLVGSVAKSFVFLLLFVFTLGVGESLLL